VQFRYGTVAVWDAATGKLLWKARTKDGTVNAVAFSRDGSMLAAAQETGKVTIYDSHTGRRGKVFFGNFQSPLTLAFTAGGNLEIGESNGILYLWNPKTGRVIGQPTLVA